MTTSLDLARVVSNYPALRDIEVFLKENFCYTEKPWEPDIIDLHSVISSDIWNVYFRNNKGHKEFMRTYVYMVNYNIVHTVSPN